MVKLSEERFLRDPNIIRLKNKLTLGKKLMKFIEEYYKRPIFGAGPALRDLENYKNSPGEIATSGNWLNFVMNRMIEFYEPIEVAYFFIGASLLEIAKLSIKKYKYPLFGFGIFSHAEEFISRVILLGKKSFDETYQMFKPGFDKLKIPDRKVALKRPNIMKIAETIKLTPPTSGSGINYIDYLDFYKKLRIKEKTGEKFAKNLNDNPDVYLTRDEKLQLILANLMLRDLVFMYIQIIKRKPTLPK